MTTLSRETITEELSNFIKENILDQSVTLDENLVFKELGIDSVAIIQIVLFIERKFDVAMTEKDLTPENLESIQSLTDFTLNNV